MGNTFYRDFRICHFGEVFRDSVVIGHAGQSTPNVFNSLLHLSSTITKKAAQCLVVSTRGTHATCRNTASVIYHVTPKAVNFERDLKQERIVQQLYTVV